MEYAMGARMVIIFMEVNANKWYKKKIVLILFHP
jgi:hypothetical protein